MARTPQSTRTCTMRSSEHAAHRLLMHSVHTSHLWLKVSPCVSFHVIHACALVCCSLSVSPHPSFYFLVLFLFQLYLMSNSAPDEFSIEDPLCNSSLGSMVTLDYVTPLTPKKQLSRTVRPVYGDEHEIDFTRTVTCNCERSRTLPGSRACEKDRKLSSSRITSCRLATEQRVQPHSAKFEGDDPQVGIVRIVRNDSKSKMFCFLFLELRNCVLHLRLILR